MMPTSRVIGGLADLFAHAFLTDPQLTHVLPAQILSWYRGQDGQWFVREMAQGMQGLAPERAHAVLVGIQALGQRAAVYFARAGGRILFGSDTPSAPTYANPPGYNGYLELRELESAGISPRQLLAAATRENAHLFGLADYGTIEPGKIASLLVLRDDPLASTAAFDTIEMVMVKGRIIERRALSASGQ
jgi:imidazolonepropionase-like amidohydrolase